MKHLGINWHLFPRLCGAVFLNFAPFGACYRIQRRAGRVVRQRRPRTSKQVVMDFRPILFVSNFSFLVFLFVASVCWLFALKNVSRFVNFGT